MNTVAQTILNQLGRQTMAMLGANNITGDTSSLTFKIGRNRSKTTHVRIVLAPSDTYTVETFFVGVVKGVPTVTKLTSTDDVYVDNLHNVIQSVTGLYAKL